MSSESVFSVAVAVVAVDAVTVASSGTSSRLDMLALRLAALDPTATVSKMRVENERVGWPVGATIQKMRNICATTTRSIPHAAQAHAHNKAHTAAAPSSNAESAFAGPNLAVGFDRLL